MHVHDTYFVVAHFHYIMVGGVLMGYRRSLFLVAEISGQVHASEGWARPGALIVFIGFSLHILRS